MAIRHASDRDLARIVDIYNAAIPSRRSTADTEPVTTDARHDWFQQHQADRRPLWVWEEAGHVAAWVSFEDFYGRPAYRHTAELSIYVAPEYQRRRLGAKLLGEALKQAPELGIKSLVGYVFSHNEGSIQLLTSAGFEEWGRLPNVAEMDGNEYSLSIMGKRL